MGLPGGWIFIHTAGQAFYNSGQRGPEYDRWPEVFLFPGLRMDEVEVTPEVLQGWNAIAEFLACDVRTAKRWETQRKLPVRRMRRTPGEGRMNVYAYVRELKAWQASANSFEESVPPAPVETAVETESSAEVRHAPRWPVFALAAAGLLCLLAVTTIEVRARGRHGEASARAVTAETGGDGASHVLMASRPGGRAQELYLHGAYLFEQRTPEMLMQAKADFEQAVAVNPRYAPAYAGLAKDYDLLREYAPMPSEKAFPLAKAAALRILDLLLEVAVA